MKQPWVGGAVGVLETMGSFEKLNRPLASCPEKKCQLCAENQAKDKKDSIISITQSSYGFSTSFFSANRSLCRRFKQSQQFHYVSVAKSNNVKGLESRRICSVPHPFLLGEVKELGSLETDSTLIACGTNLALLTSTQALLKTHKEKTPLEFLVTLLCQIQPHINE